jgi:hypothetical protein
MERITLETEGGREAYEPGAELRGRVSWELESPAQRVEVRLFWYTRGKGTTDVRVVKVQRFDVVGLRGQHDFRFVLPEEPYSFSGKLISLVWALEALAEPGDRSVRMDLVVAPEGKEVQLQSVPRAI